MVISTIIVELKKLFLKIEQTDDGYTNLKLIVMMQVSIILLLNPQRKLTV